MHVKPWQHEHVHICWDVLCLCIHIRTVCIFLGMYCVWVCHRIPIVRIFLGFTVCVNVLARISNYLDESACRIIHNSFVSSNFNYCPLVWHFCGVTNGNKVEKIQERCLRIIYKDYESSYDRLLDRTNTTKLAISRLRILILEVFKSIHMLNPKCISDLFELKSTSFSLRNNVKVLQPKRRTTTYGLRTSSYTGAKLWNDLSPILSNVGNVDIFKSSLTL